MLFQGNTTKQLDKKLGRPTKGSVGKYIIFSNFTSQLVKADLESHVALVGRPIIIFPEQCTVILKKLNSEITDLNN